MGFLLIGALLVVIGIVMSRDLGGFGARWRNASMSFYDRRGGPDAYDRNTRRFRLYYRMLTVFGLFLLLGGLLSIA
jgi:hypothetical protein